MKAVFENDMERGRGYARLHLAEVADISAGNWRFSLCRGSDQTYLGRSGWQNSEDFMEPETYTASGNELVLRIGPAVVDYLDVNENYRIALHGEGLAAQRAVLAITSINSSMIGTTAKLASAQPKKAEPAPVPKPEPAPVPKPEPEPMPEPEPELLLQAPAPAQNKSYVPLILLALLLLGAAGGGAWWYMNKQKTSDLAQTASTEQKAPEAAKPEEAKPEPVKAEEPKPEPAKAEPPKPEDPKKAEVAQAEPAKPAPPASAREQVRQFFSGTPSGQNALDLYGKLPASSPEEQDSAYRLLLFAAEEGQDKAFVPLARSTDPLTPPFGSISKDAAEAWNWYSKAAPNNPEAGKALEKLKGWLEAEAAKGNKQAIDWINKIAASANKK